MQKLLSVSCFQPSPAFLTKHKKLVFHGLFSFLHYSHLILRLEKNNVHEPADGGNSPSDPTCQILLSPLKSNSWRRLDCFVGLTLGEEKKAASESKAAAHPTVSMNYSGSMTSIIQKVFFVCLLFVFCFFHVYCCSFHCKLRLVFISLERFSSIGTKLISFFLPLSLWKCVVALQTAV